jgi:hypothetical protein
MYDGIEVCVAVTKKISSRCNGMAPGFVQFKITGVIKCEHLFIIKRFAHYFAMCACLLRCFVAQDCRKVSGIPPLGFVSSGISILIWRNNFLDVDKRS